MFVTDLQVSQFFMSILQNILKSVVLQGFSSHMVNTNSLVGGGGWGVYMFVTDLQVSQFFMSVLQHILKSVVLLHEVALAGSHVHEVVQCLGQSAITVTFVA